jgi:hypothetical protein
MAYDTASHGGDMERLGWPSFISKTLNDEVDSETEGYECDCNIEDRYTPEIGGAAIAFELFHTKRG